MNPFFATSMGVPGHDHEVPDYSPAGNAKFHELDRELLDKLDEIDVTDEIDRVTLAAIRERLGLEGELYDAGEHLASLNVIASPLQSMRDIFDLMPTETVENWQNIAARLSKLPQAMAGYIESLRAGAKRGLVPAVRQVKEGIKQAEELAGPNSFFVSFAKKGADSVAANDPTLQQRLAAGAAAAQSAYQELADFLVGELIKQAPEKDGVGKERYQRFSRYFLGDTVDLEETYQWGIEELRRTIAEQTAVAAEIAGPGATVADAVKVLDADEKYILHGVTELKAWMQETSNQAIRELNGTQFDIPEVAQSLECMIAPTQNGGIYYTPPSDDMSRPGRMWWSVPEGVNEFQTWQQRTTVYHEGVPGHHLQCSTAAINRDQLNSWRRNMCWCSGHGEGWALYAEKLMDELGYLKDAADRLGMLFGQRMRAARVVFDIGMHLGLNAPPEWGGKPWDAETGWEFLKENMEKDEEFVRFEFNRYLGWPGQAPAYKIGQRLWEQARARAEAAAVEKGEAFDIKAFHRNALALGSVPLCILRTEL
ncbi:MAG: DUF885 domain-containing protein [Cellulomonadaceae bacterium]|nr:DUF885 domain-containing protein [Cellulomonadaceae bacterium]